MDYTVYFLVLILSLCDEVINYSNPKLIMSRQEYLDSMRRDPNEIMKQHLKKAPSK